MTEVHRDVVSDLDGVIYRGDHAIAGAAEALSRLESSGARIIFVTNNSTRTPEKTAEKIERMTGIPTDREQVITSSQAAAALLKPADSPSLVVGEEGVWKALAELDLETTETPSEARSVIVGMDRSLTYNKLAKAADAVRNGARFIATNTDATFPTPNGLLPGAGAIVASIAAAGGVSPEVAGKPHASVRRLLGELGVREAWVIGDRVDTDVALAAEDSLWSSILVLSGVTGSEDDVSSADYVVADFASAVDLLLSVDARP